MPTLPYRARWSVLALVCVAACHGAPNATISAPAPIPSAATYVVATASSRAISLSDLAEVASTADVVFFGEEHTDPETHRTEFALLQAIGRKRNDVILSLEMFERDVQTVLDDYVARRISEAEFLTKCRPWPRYAIDYRDMVEFAKSKGWPVIASNVPRVIASAVGRKGLLALDSLPPEERVFAARTRMTSDASKGRSARCLL